jgi:hypothetical protein
MAEFSKEWVEAYNPEGFQADFDIVEEFDKLEEDTMISQICEGYGFIAIGKAAGKDAPVLLYRFDTGIEMGYWKDPVPEGFTGEDAFWLDYDEMIDNYPKPTI